VPLHDEGCNIWIIPHVRWRTLSFYFPFFLFMVSSKCWDRDGLICFRDNALCDKLCNSSLRRYSLRVRSSTRTTQKTSLCDCLLLHDPFCSSATARHCELKASDEYDSDAVSKRVFKLAHAQFSESGDEACQCPTHRTSEVKRRQFAINQLAAQRDLSCCLKSAIKSSRSAVSFRGICSLDSAFFFLRWFKLARICIEVTGLCIRDRYESTSKFLKTGNRFHVTLRILSPKILFK